MDVWKWPLSTFGRFGTQSQLDRETFGSLLWLSRRSQTALQSLRWYRIKNSFHLPQPDFWPDWEQRGSLPLMLVFVLVRGGSHLCVASALAPFHRAAWHVGGAEKPCLKHGRRARPLCAVFKEKLCLRECQSQLICSCADIHPIKLSKEFTSQRPHLFTSDCPGLTWPTVSEKNKLHCQQKAAICRVVTIKVRAEGCVWAKSTLVCQDGKALTQYVLQISAMWPCVFNLSALLSFSTSNISLLNLNCLPQSYMECWKRQI